MSVEIRRQLNNAAGAPISGATVNAYREGDTTIRSTTTSDTDGYFTLDLVDTYVYDLEVIFSGNKWWIRGSDSGQLARLDITEIFRLPRYTTTDRDALSLGTSDAGTQIYNTTDDEVQTWDGSDWQGDPSQVSVGTIASLDITEVADEAAYDALASPDDDTIYWWEE